VLAATLYHVNTDTNHKLWNIVSTEIYTPYAGADEKAIRKLVGLFH
jgi:hypothetical protein